MPPSQIELQTTPAVQQPTDDADESSSSCPKCIFDRLPPEMIRFIFRKQSTDDLLQASAVTDRLYRVAQHHMYLSDGALLVRGGQDTAATVTRAYDVRNATALYLVDVRDFGRDVPRGTVRAGLRTLHVGYTRPAGYAADLSAAGVRRLLRAARADRVCFDNVLMTADDVADAVSARLEAQSAPQSAPSAQPAFRCSYDRADDAAVLELLGRVQATCAGLLSEFRVTVRRPAPRAYAPVAALGAPRRRRRLRRAGRHAVSAPHARARHGRRHVRRTAQRSGTGPGTAVASAGRLPVRDRRGAAARRPAAAAAPAAAGPDRVRQDDGDGRAGHAVRRLRAGPRAAADRAAGRGPRGRGVGRRGAAAAALVPAHVRPAVAAVAGPRGRPAPAVGRLAARVDGPFPRPSRGPRRPPLVHQDRRVRRLTTRPRRRRGRRRATKTTTTTTTTTDHRRDGREFVLRSRPRPAEYYGLTIVVTVIL